MKQQIQYKIFVSNLLNSAGKNETSKGFKKIYEEIIRIAKDHKIEVIPVKNTEDIWIRDFMPIQIEEKTFVTYRYKPDYLSTPERKKYITDIFYNKKCLSQIPEPNRCEELYGADVEIRECKLILDGGNVVVCGDKVILTDKVFIENRPKTQDYVLGELIRAFGKEVIIIPSDPYEIELARENNELPLCHADGVVAPIGNESILIADYGEDRYGYVPALMNVLSRYFKPENIKHFDLGKDWTEDTWVYINFLRVGDVVLMPTVDYVKKGRDGKIEDPAYQEKLRRCNEKAKEQLKYFLGVDKIETIDTTTLSLGKNNEGEDIKATNCGGALHCITWEVKS